MDLCALHSSGLQRSALSSKKLGLMSRGCIGPDAFGLEPQSFVRLQGQAVRRQDHVEQWRGVDTSDVSSRLANNGRRNVTDQTRGVAFGGSHMDCQELL